MITLKTAIPIHLWQVQGRISKREKQSPFVAVLLQAQEQGFIDAQSLQEHLLPNLPLKAFENLLNRLTRQDYLSKDEDEEPSYSLTEKGEESAQSRSVWTEMEGIYNLYWVDMPFVAQRIVHIETRPKAIDFKKSKRNEDQSSHKPSSLPLVLQDLRNHTFVLEQEEYRLDSLEKNGVKLGESEADFSLIVRASKTPRVNLDFTTKEEDRSISYQAEWTEASYESIRHELLEDELGSYVYDRFEDCCKIPFDGRQTSFERQVRIKQPELNGLSFSPTDIKQVAHQPDSQEAAQKWFEALLEKNMKDYFFGEASFEAFQQTYQDQYQTYQPDILTREQMMTRLQQHLPQSFFALSTLQSPLILS